MTDQKRRGEDGQTEGQSHQIESNRHQDWAEEPENLDPERQPECDDDERPQRNEEQVAQDAGHTAGKIRKREKRRDQTGARHERQSADRHR
jgi:hypothetical protein